MLNQKDDSVYRVVDSHWHIESFFDGLSALTPVGILIYVGRLLHIF